MFLAFFKKNLVLHVDGEEKLFIVIPIVKAMR